jgi:flagellar protein FlgJ
MPEDLRVLGPSAIGVLRPERPATAAGPKGVDPKLKDACEQMESLFINTLLTEMRKTVDTSGLMDGGRSEEIYTSLMDAELAKQMARAGGVGLARILIEQLSLRGRSRLENTP